MNATIAISIIAACIALFGLVMTVLSYRDKKKKDAEESGSDRGVMASDLGYIKAGIDDLKQEHREDRQRMDAIQERVTRCEESTKQAHHRIDEIRKEIQ